MTRIDHTFHSHPNTPAARAECRKVLRTITLNHEKVMIQEVEYARKHNIPREHLPEYLLPYFDRG